MFRVIIRWPSYNFMIIKRLWLCRLFKQFLLLVLVHQMASGLFRFIGAAGRTMGVATTFGAFALVLQFALSGFVLSRSMFYYVHKKYFSCSVILLFMFFFAWCYRWCEEMVDLGLLDLTINVFCEFNSCEWIWWEEMGPCKCFYTEPHANS